MNSRANLNIGLEMQAPQLHLGNDQDGVFYSPPTFTVFSLSMDETANEELSVYADNETGNRNVNLSCKQQREYEEFHKIQLVYKSVQYSSQELHFHIHPKEEWVSSIFNDAEFVWTCKRKEEIILDEYHLLSYIVSKCIEGCKNVIGHVKKLKEYELKKANGMKLINNLERKRRVGCRMRCIPWTFQKVFRQVDSSLILHGKEKNLGPLLFYSRDKNLNWKDLCFHFQSTIGIPLSHCWKVMVLLAKKTLDIPSLNPMEKQYMEDILLFDKKLPEISDDLCASFYPLLVYWLKTKEDNRKKYGFILRHLMINLIKVIDKNQLETFILPNLDSAEWRSEAMELFEGPFIEKQDHETLEEFRERKLIYKEKEEVDTTTTYPVFLEGNSTFILIEFRFLNQLLNHILHPKSDYLGKEFCLSDLIKIQNKIFKSKTRV